MKCLVQKKPSPPILKTQLKLHEFNIPIRPLINITKVSTYKIARHLIRIFKEHLTPNNHYNVVNSTNLANDLTKLKIKEHLKLITYNIQDLYVNNPEEGTLTIIKPMFFEE